MPVILITGEPTPAAANAVVLNCPRAMVCRPFTAVLIALMFTNSTLPLKRCMTVPVTKLLAGEVLYQPRVSCTCVLLVTS